ncbi:acyltransferase family protein [Microbacterium sp. NPDC055599]
MPFLASSSAASASPSSRVSGLTGLRGLAVVAVLGYHLLPAAVPGGLIGVDVFFVVSGFIVTRLLLRERARTGRVSLGAFWARRARRILPALALVLAVCIPLAFLVAPHLLSGIRRQLIGALTFSSNWLAIAADGDYFQADQPDLFTNLWSLAVEEQFYLIWPLLLVLLLVVVRWRRRAVVVLALVLAVLSAGAMVLLSAPPLGSPTRAYFGTDTHAFGLLLGVALAVGMGAGEVRMATGRRAVARTALGVASLGVLVALAVVLSDASPAAAHGGLALASLAALGLIWSAATVPPLGRVLDAAPLSWLGERSYAVYLWHWPLLLILGATPLAAQPLLVAVVAAALSILVAALSYAFVETPFRRGLRVHPPLPRRHVVLPALVVGVLAVASAGIAIGHDDASAAEALVERGREAIAHAAPAPAASPQTGSGADSGPTPSPSPSPTSTAATPPPILGTDITAVGDSVMLAAAPELQNALPGIAIDAQVSRSMWPATGILSSLANDGALRPTVVVGLATNGGVDPDLLADILGIVGPDRTLVFVNAHAQRSWIPGGNATLADFAAAYPNVTVADWDGAITPYPDDLAGDGIHPQPAGGDIYAAVVTGAIAQAHLDEAQAADAAAKAAADAAREAAKAAKKPAAATARPDDTQHDDSHAVPTPTPTP